MSERASFGKEVCEIFEAGRGVQPVQQNFGGEIARRYSSSASGKWPRIFRDYVQCDGARSHLRGALGLSQRIPKASLGFGIASFGPEDYLVMEYLEGEPTG